MGIVPEGSPCDRNSRDENPTMAAARSPNHPRLVRLDVVPVPAFGSLDFCGCTAVSRRLPSHRFHRKFYIADSGGRHPSHAVARRAFFKRGEAIVGAENRSGGGDSRNVCAGRSALRCRIILRAPCDSAAAVDCSALKLGLLRRKIALDPTKIVIPPIAFLSVIRLGCE